MTLSLSKIQSDLTVRNGVNDLPFHNQFLIHKISGMASTLKRLPWILVPDPTNRDQEPFREPNKDRLLGSKSFPIMFPVPENRYPVPFQDQC